MANWYFVTLVLFLGIKNSFSQNQGYFRKIIGSVAREIFDYTCREETTCQLEAMASYGCHLYYANSPDETDSCLVTTYSGASPTVYVKPGEGFESLEVHMFNRFCIRRLLELGKWVLSSDMFPEANSWYEVKIQVLVKEERYLLLVNDKEVAGEKLYYTSLNNTHFQIVTKGSATWSFDCNPQSYSSAALVPWIMLSILAILLIVVLIGIIVYCSRKLNRRAEGFSDRKSLQHSSRSTVSLISSPFVFNNESRESRCSGTRSWTQSPTSVSSNICHQQWSSNRTGIPDQDTQSWSHAPISAHMSHGSKKWSYVAGVDTPFGCQNFSNHPQGRPCSEHVYEEIDEHIYEEVDDFRPNVFTNGSKFQPDQRPVFPLMRSESKESSFSTANSLYGYR